MPALRSSWKGFLKLSLVSVPVKAYTANNTSEELHLNQLHEGCHNRVRYLKVCPEHGELKPSEIVSGYEYAKDQYVVIDPSELQKLRPESDHTVRIDGFVRPAEVDPIYSAGKTYVLLPDGAPGKKPYALLVRGMQDADVVAIAQIVLSGREQLVSVKPVENLLVMTVLHVAKKVKSLGEFTGEVPAQDLAPQELALAETLIEASRIEDFDYAAYEDAYVEKLSALIQMKVEGQEVVQAPDSEEPRILNLMDALKKSVAAAKAAQSNGADEGAAKKKMAPSSAQKPERKTKKSG